MHAGKLKSVKHAGILGSGEIQTKPEGLMRSDNSMLCYLICPISDALLCNYSDVML